MSTLHQLVINSHHLLANPAKKLVRIYRNKIKGLLGRGGPTKTLFLPQARAQSVPTSRLVLAGTGRNVLALHSRPPSLPTPAN